MTQIIFDQMKSFVNFGEEDARNLVAMGPLMANHQADITDYFYEVLARYPETSKFLEGQVERLKKTHAAWFSGLFAGDYGEGYFESRHRIGLAHVRIGLDPYWVEAVMSIIRTKSLTALAQEHASALDVARHHMSLCKLLDLDLLVINLSYQEERLDRLVNFTGMKRALIENIIRIPKKTQ